jgi:flagellar protein FlbD
MIHLTRINRMPLVLNADLIEHLEVTPDTVISLTNGQKFVVRESADQVIDLVVAFRRRIAERFEHPDLFGRSKPVESPAA